MFWKKKSLQPESKIVQEISNSWGWTGIRPIEVVRENEFGNLIIKDTQGAYWRLCPEDVYCRVIALNDEELEILFANKEFQEDWEMKNLVAEARSHFGDLMEGRKYCLKIPSVAGGSYALENFGTNTLLEMIGFSGDIGYQIKDLPDGTKIKLTIE